jgi:hypothetical protein
MPERQRADAASVGRRAGQRIHPRARLLREADRSRQDVAGGEVILDFRFQISEFRLIVQFQDSGNQI